MPRITPIDDPADPRVLDYVGLTDPDLRRRRERSGHGGHEGDDGGFVIAEGLVVIRELLRSPYRVRSLLLTQPRLAALESEVEHLDVQVFVGTQEVVNGVTGFHLHRGAVASADRRPLPSVDEVASDVDLLVMTEGLNDHENLGALFRNASAFGVGAVLMDPTSADPLYRRSIRVSVGQVLHVPFAVADPWPDTIRRLQQLGFEVLALTPGPAAEPLGGVERWSRQAVLVGAEGPGLSAGALAAADRRVRIPLAPGVDSLNVATAAAIALHHLARPT